MVNLNRLIFMLLFFSINIVNVFYLFTELSMNYHEKEKVNYHQEKKGFTVTERKTYNDVPIDWERERKNLLNKMSQKELFGSELS